MKTSELTGAALDWAVAIAEGFKPSQLYISKGYRPEFTSIYTITFDEDGQPEGYMTGPDRLYSRKWEAGGQIIENFSKCEASFCLFFSPYDHVSYGKNRPWKAEFKGASYWAETPLIAAMRCYVASKLGDTVEIPEELK